MKILVAGATGGCGRLVVRRLADLCIATRVLTRDARRAVSLGPVEGNALSPEDCRRATEGCEAVICTLGDPAARRFILVSSAGAGDSWAPFFVRWLFWLLRVMPIIQEKARPEAYVRLSRLQWTIVRPGFLTNSCASSRYYCRSQAGLPVSPRGRRWRMLPSAVCTRRTPSTKYSR